jgi:hypothetical protein
MLPSPQIGAGAPVELSPVELSPVLSPELSVLVWSVLWPVVWLSEPPPVVGAPVVSALVSPVVPVDWPVVVMTVPVLELEPASDEVPVSPLQPRTKQKPHATARRSSETIDPPPTDMVAVNRSSPGLSSRRLRPYLRPYLCPYLRPYLCPHRRPLGRGGPGGGDRPRTGLPR